MRRRHKSTYIFVPEKQHGGSGFFWLMLLAVVALCAMALLMNQVSNNRARLEEEKVSMMNLDKTFEGFTVLHLSDLHAANLGNDIDAWKKLLYGKTFHAVVMSGDMVGSGNDYEPLLSLIHALREVRADVPIYLIAGDDDPDPVIYLNESDVRKKGEPRTKRPVYRQNKNAGKMGFAFPGSMQASQRRLIIMICGGLIILVMGIILGIWLTAGFSKDIDAPDVIVATPSEVSYAEADELPAAEQTHTDAGRSF